MAGFFDDLIPSGADDRRREGAPPLRGGSGPGYVAGVPRRQPAANAFADLLPVDDGARPGPAKLPSPTPAPDTEEAPSPGFLDYATEFGKGIGRGAADLAETTLKGASAAQQVFAQGQVKFLEDQMRLFEAIDTGKQTDPAADAYGYRSMSVDDRAKTRMRVRANVDRFRLPGGVQDRELFKGAEEVGSAGRRALPAAPGWEDSTTAALGEGTGSVVGGLPLALAGPATATLAYGLAGSGEALDRARADGAGEQDQLKAALLGVAPGTTDVLPLEILMGRLPLPIPAAAKAPLARALARIGGQAFVEGLQEGGQQFLQNLIAREVYKPKQGLSEGIVPNAELGAGVGTLAATAKEAFTSLVGGRHFRNGHRGEPQKTDSERQPAAPNGLPGSNQPGPEDRPAPRNGDRLPVLQPGDDLRQFGELDEHPEHPAVRIGDRVFFGGSHHVALGNAGEVMGPGVFTANPDAVAHGYVTNRGRFVSKKLAGLLIGKGGRPLNPLVLDEWKARNGASAERDATTRAAEEEAVTGIPADAPEGETSDFAALTPGGYRQLYGEYDETPIPKRSRPVDKTALEISADRLQADLANFEKSLRGENRSPEEIASAINDRFDVDVTPEDVASGNLWWRMDRRGRLPAPERPRGPARTRWSEDADAIVAGDTVRSYAEIANELKARFDIKVSPEAVKSRRRDLRRRGADVASRTHLRGGWDTRPRAASPESRLDRPERRSRWSAETDALIAQDASRHINEIVRDLRENHGLTDATAENVKARRKELRRRGVEVVSRTELAGTFRPGHRSAHKPGQLDLNDPTVADFLSSTEARATPASQLVDQIRDQLGVETDVEGIRHARRTLTRTGRDAHSTRSYGQSGEGKWSDSELAIVRDPASRHLAKAELADRIKQETGIERTPRAVVNVRYMQRRSERAQGREPLFASQPLGHVSDTGARHEAVRRLNQGETVRIEDGVVADVQAALLPLVGRVPRGVDLGVLSEIRPIEPSVRNGYADVEATYERPDGSRFRLRTFRAMLRDRRAFFIGGDIGVIGVNRFAPAGETSGYLRGGLAHELVHVGYATQVINRALWLRLVRHAEDLRILDSSFQTFLRNIRDPDWRFSDPSISIGDLYREIYAGRDNLQDALEQEAVAHLVELYSHHIERPSDNIFTDEEVPLIEADLEEVLSGPTSASRRGAGWFFAAGPDDHTRPNQVVTPGGEMEVQASPRIVDLTTLRPATDDLQPRDRSRAEGTIGVRQRAASLDPSRLKPERVSDGGAPIISSDGMVISGNGRVASIAEAYGDPALAERGDAYRQAVLDQADALGMGEEARAMRAPVLVQVLDRDISRDELVRFADLSNRSSIAQMSAPERAVRDVRAAGADLMGLYRGGDFTAPENREFLRAFVSSAVTDNERGGFSRDGQITKEGEDRLSAAVLAAAYGDPAMLSRMLESTDDNIRGVTGALRDAAGGFVRLKEAIRNGEASRDFDITEQIAETARRIADLRSRGVRPEQFLAQQDAFSKLDPVVEDLLRAFHGENMARALGRDRLGALLNAYAEEAAKHKNGGLIPDETRVADIVRYARQRALSAGRPSPPSGAHGRPGAANQGPPPIPNRPPQAGPPPIPGTANRRALTPPPPSGRGGRGGPPPLPPSASSGPPMAPNQRAQIARALNSWRTSVVEFLQNSDVRVKRMVELVGQGRLPDTADPYLKATLFYGRVGAKTRHGYDEARAIVDDTAALAKRAGMKLADAREMINDYLIARHAPERNTQHGPGAAGMTNAEIGQIIAAVNGRPDAAETKRIAARAINLHRLSLDLLHEAGVISDQTFNRLRTTYPNHVPLNRVIPNTDDIGPILAGRGFDVYASGIKRAKGSDLEVRDILGNIVTNYEQAVLRSEKNLVDLSSLMFLRRHATDLQGLMRERRPRIIGQSSRGQPILEQTQDPRILHLFEDGHPVWVEFQDPRLASAFKNSNREQLGPMMRFVASVTRLYAGLNTRFNPEFAGPNKLRDLQEAMIYMAAQGRGGARGAAKTAFRDPASIKAIVDHLAGRSTPGANLYAQMVADGGTTGGLGLSTRRDVELNIAQLERLATSSPRRFAAGLVDLVDNWNTVFEDSTRLSIYKTALDQGASRERAAFLAKEGTVNFNRMGTAGPVINGFWMFSNASIQGTAKMVRSLRNPRVAAAVSVTIAAAVAAVSQWNDEIDPEWRDKVAKWDRLNGLPVLLPSVDGGVRYVTIPVSWGLKPIYVAASAAYDALSGVSGGLGKALSDVTTSILEGYNPLGGTDLISAITPTFLDTPFDIARNRSWSGNRIRPDFDPNMPRDKQYFMSLKDTAFGRAAIRTTEMLHDTTGLLVSPADLSYAIEQLVGGAGRAARKTLDTLIGAAQGQLPPASDFPFLSRFYRERSEEETGRGAGGDTEDIKGRLQSQSRERFDARSRADDVLRMLEGGDEDSERAALRQLRRTDPDTAKIVADRLKERDTGINFTDRQISQLGVANGERAEYLAERLAGLDEGAKREMLAEWRRKKLLPPAVWTQVVRILNGHGRPKPRRPGTTGLFDDLPATAAGR